MKKSEKAVLGTWRFVNRLDDTAFTAVRAG
jgi:hypothetical protein